MAEQEKRAFGRPGFPLEVRQKVVELNRGGKSAQKIQEETGISLTTIYGILREAKWAGAPSPDRLRGD